MRIATKFFITSLGDLPCPRRAAAIGAHVIKTSALLALVALAVLAIMNHTILNNSLMTGSIALGIGGALFAARLARIAIHPGYISLHTKDAYDEQIKGVEDISKERSIKVKRPLNEYEQAEIDLASDTIKNVHRTLVEKKTFIKKEMGTVIFIHCLLAIICAALSVLKIKNYITNVQFGSALLALLVFTPFLFEGVNRRFTNNYANLLEKGITQKLQALQQSNTSESS